MQKKVFGDLRHAISSKSHLVDGTHKSADPVSKTTLNFCGGVPIVISP